MATSWPKDRRLIGKDIPRTDGPEKSTGRARYSIDMNPKGLLHAMILRSPYAHAHIDAIDVSAAEKTTGFKAVHEINGAGKEVYFAGDEIIAVCADTEEHCRDAMRAIKIKFTPLEFFVKEADALKNPQSKTISGPAKSNVAIGAEATKGDVAAGFKDAEKIVEADYGMPVICHQCLEPHGLVASWEGDRLTVWASTQAVVGTAQQLAATFKARIPQVDVKCITHYMGGGYGSKFGPDIQGIVAAELALKTKAPVKLMLNREEEITVGGNRPSAYGKIKIGGKKDGTITAYEVDCHGSPGERGGATVNLGLLPYVYLDTIPNWKRKHTVVRLNTGIARAMRAPGHPQNCVLTDCPVDDLAAALGIDPLIIRRKNLPPNDDKVAQSDPTAWLGQRNNIYVRELDLAVKLSEWEKKWHQPGQGGKGPIKHGIGMAIHTWGGSAVGNLGDGQPANDATVIIDRGGQVIVQSSTQDLGTAQRTVSAIVAAEILGLKVSDIVVRIGESPFGRSSGSGGSTTCPSQAPATLRAAIAARDDLFAKIAAKFGAKKEDLVIEEGKVVDKASKKGLDWKKACAMLGMDEAKGVGAWSSNMANEIDPDKKILVNPGVSNVQVGGVQVAEVLVDVETGVVRCTNFVAVQDCGLIIDKLTCESQVAGGVIMGVNYALFEDRIMDRHTGRQVNPDMEFYKLGGIQDLPRIKVAMVDMPERGVIGIGEPPTVSTAAAVGNAVFNALGVRVPYAPYSPENVLNALAKKGAKG
ncbi:MAG: xanthine dehydrogenase family protein molybdopterin-binding subunit [Gemmataceae bacterium]|nr:xanthine dehydrogenase family protein molybdopterin-binding subunit [Gemmataceae bacterium]